MKQFREQIEVPNELDGYINKGIAEGKKKMKQRKKSMIRSVACAAVCIGVFAVSVNVAPAFATTMREVPVLGVLVQIFQINKPEVSGGSSGEHAKGEIYLDRQKDKEQLIINFADGEKANQYNAVYHKNPQSVTITLPGTTKLDLLSDFKLAEGESDFIKSVYQLLPTDDNMVRCVVEIEDYSNIQIKEYKNPGQIVIELTHDEEYQLKDIYSVRSLSFENNQEFVKREQQLKGVQYRILKDENELRFFEFAQFENEKEAQKFAEKFNVPGQMEAVIEKRFGNYVPCCFKDRAAYDEYVFTVKYGEFLHNVTTLEEIMQFIDQNKEAHPEYLELMLRGLTGMVRSMEPSEYDSKKVDEYYGLIGTTLEQQLSKYHQSGSEDGEI